MTYGDLPEDYQDAKDDMLLLQSVLYMLRSILLLAKINILGR